MKSTVTLSKVKFQELVSRGLNRPMIAKELGITVKLVNEAFTRWDLRLKKTSNAVIWDDNEDDLTDVELTMQGEVYQDTANELTIEDLLGIADPVVETVTPVIVSNVVTVKTEDLEEATF